MSKISRAGIGILISLILISGANAIAVENIKKLDIPETDLWDVILSPDGMRLAFIAYDEKHTQQIFVMNTDGTGEKKLTDDSNKKWGLAWGKDKIAYISFGKDGLEKIFVINPDGTGNKQLIIDDTRQGNFDKYMVAWGAPSWSPDGTLLAYTSLDEKTNPKMYVVKADGTDKRLVIDDSFKQWSPSFSPDTKSIVYVSYPESKNKEELFTVEISGIARKQLTFDEIKKNYPVWGPDGTIVFVSYESVTSSGEKLFAISKDGTNRRLFINTDYKQRSPSFSLDGRKFAYAAIDVSGNIKIAVADITGITGIPEVTPATTTPLPDGKTPESTSTGQETAGDKKKPMPSVSIVPVIAVILLLALLMKKNIFKK
jgi:Tol biopolymer transport system component